jgi:pectin methylesterase-like acyl-CoA thioesterase
MSEFHGASLAQADRPINSNGKSFATIQAAIDELAGDGFVYVPAGTWSEALTISDNNVELFGAGWASIIDGGTTGTAVLVSGDGCVIRDLQVATTAAGTNTYDGVKTTGDDVTVVNVYVSASDQHGLFLDGTQNIAIGCRVDACDDDGVLLSNSKLRVVGNYVDDAVNIDAVGDDSIVSGNYITGASANNAASDDHVWDSNRNPGGFTDNTVPPNEATIGDNDET